jgi:Protein of unknown function (DUF4089)
MSRMDTDELDRELTLVAGRLGIVLLESWRPAVREYVIAIRKASDLVESFPLSDEADPAPVFEA